MEIYSSLFGIAKALLSEDDAQTPELIFRRGLEATSADRGFIVLREGDSYEQKFDVHFDRGVTSTHERRFSRALVRQAIQTRQIIHSERLSDDPRFADVESIQQIGPCAVLVAPLHYEDQVYGVIYLERRSRDGGFSEDARRLLREFAEVAGLFLRRALEREALRQRNQALERDLFAQHDFNGIVTQHPRMISLLRAVAQVADADASVLIRGETGTGKELIARALHVNSGRRDKPFVTLHTMALSGTLLESELFGHVQGSFTGATRDRSGRIATAHRGTLFLDEVAEITPEVQVKLLRFLESGEIQRVGSDKVETVDARVVAATHQELPALIEQGRFRRDLYHRLKVIELELPPLRDRASDIPLLVDCLLRKHWKRSGERPRLSPEAEHALMAYGYPGNVRELAHIVERACILSTSPEIGIDLLPPELRAAPPAPAFATRRFFELTKGELEAAREAALREVEATFLRELMQRHGGNVSLAARASGIHRSQLQKLLAEHRQGPKDDGPELTDAKERLAG